MTSKEFAEELDQILSNISEKENIHNHKIGQCSFETLGDRLEKDGYGKWLGGNEFQVYPQGVNFLKTGGYVGLELERQRKREIEISNAILTRKQVNALKAQPWLIAWGVIATLAALILSFFQIFVK